MDKSDLLDSAASAAAQSAVKQSENIAQTLGRWCASLVSNSEFGLRWRLDNLSRISARFDRLCQARGISPTQRDAIASKFGILWLEGASMEEADSLQALWAELLASEAVDGQVPLAAISALKMMRPRDAAVFQRAWVSGGDGGFGIRTVRSFDIVVGPAGDVSVEIVGAVEYDLNFAITDPMNPGRSFASSIFIAQPLVTTLGPGLVQGASMSSAEAHALSIANGNTDSEVVFSTTPDDPVAAVATSMATGPSSGPVREVFDAWQLQTRHRVFIGDALVSVDSTSAAYDSDLGYLLDNVDSSLFDFAAGTGLLAGVQEHRFALANPGLYAVTLVDEFYGFLEHRQIPAPGTLLLVGLGMLGLRWRGSAAPVGAAPAARV